MDQKFRDAMAFYQTRKKQTMVQELKEAAEIPLMPENEGLHTSPSLVTLRCDSHRWLMGPGLQMVLGGAETLIPYYLYEKAPIVPSPSVGSLAYCRCL